MKGGWGRRGVKAKRGRCIAALSGRDAFLRATAGYFDARARAARHESGKRSIAVQCVHILDIAAPIVPGDRAALVRRSIDAQ